MTRTRRVQLAIGLSMTFVLLSWTHAGDLSLYYMDRVGGTFSSTVLDTNGDSVPGTEGKLQGYSSRGQVSVQFFSEFDILAAQPSADCPPDFLEVPVVTSSSVITFYNGDILMLKTVSETMCGNLESGQFQWKEVLEVIGGTGLFAGASGRLETNGTGQFLESDPTGVVSFGAVQMDTKGRVGISIN